MIYFLDYSFWIVVLTKAWQFEHLVLQVTFRICFSFEVIIIIIMIAYLYCAAYTRMTMNESSPICEQTRIIFNNDGQRVQLARPQLPEPHYICMYRLLPNTLPSQSRHYYPRFITGINLPTPNGWTAWLADYTHITFSQGYYTIAYKGTRRK